MKYITLSLLILITAKCYSQSSAIFKKIQVNESISLNGKLITLFSDDVTDFGRSDILPTQQAVKSYVDSKLSLPSIDEVLAAGNTSLKEIKTGLHTITIPEAAGSAATEIMSWNIPLNGVPQPRYKWVIAGGSGAPGLFAGNLALQSFDNSGSVYKTPLIWDRGSATWSFFDNVYIGNINSPDNKVVKYGDRAAAVWNADKLNGIVVTGSPQNGQVLSYNASSNVWIPQSMLNADADLQKVTNAGNITINAMQISGAERYDPSRNSLLLAYGENVSTIGNIANGGLSASIDIGENVVSIGFNPTNAVEILNPSIILGKAADFNGRVSGQNAQAGNEFITLQQLDDRIPLTSSYIGTVGLTEGNQTITVNTSAIKENSVVILNIQECIQCNFTPVVSSRIPGESFTITCIKNEGVLLKIGWIIVNPSN